MGTPQDGAYLADVLSRLLKLLNKDREFIKDMNPQGETIATISWLFNPLMDAFHLVSFYETEEIIPGSGIVSLLIVRVKFTYAKLVVPENEAQLPGVESYPLNGNHINIVKFSSKEDPNYLNVSGMLSLIVQGLKN